MLSKIFLPLLSKDAIKNFPTLTANSNCDNVLLEHHLALELRSRGLIEFILPVMIGDITSTEGEAVYANYFSSKCHPNLANANVVVESVKEKCIQHLERQSLGSPLLSNMTVKSIMGEITSNQGCFIEGSKTVSLYSKFICHYTYLFSIHLFMFSSNMRREIYSLHLGCL